MPKAYLYGAFQDGSRKSSVCTDVNMGDLFILKAVQQALHQAGIIHQQVVLPDEQTPFYLAPSDLLVVGGGGLIHEGLLNHEALSVTKARVVVFNVGCNYNLGVRPDRLQRLQQRCAFMDTVSAVSVRDWHTKAFLRSERAQVHTDVSWSYWKSSDNGGKRAVVASASLKQEPGEDLLVMNRSNITAGYQLVKSPEEFRPYGKIRAESFHGMMYGLMVGAEVETHIIDVRKESFLLSNYDCLTVREEMGAALIKCTDPTELHSRANKALEWLKVCATR